MSLSCVRLTSCKDLATLLKKYERDHWVSALADTSLIEFPDRIQTTRVEDRLVTDIFSHCYYVGSTDVKTDSDFIIKHVGLGLRKKGVRSKNVSGVVFAFIKEAGPTLLSQKREDLSADDKKLSSEERLRRTHMQFDVAPLEYMIAEAKRHPGSFWLTCWVSTDVEEGKKKVVCTSVEGQLATQRFKRCILTDVANCNEATSSVTRNAGLGLRNTAVRARASIGCVALLLTGEGLPPLPLPAAKGSKGAPPEPAQPASKRPRTEAATHSRPTLPVRSEKEKSRSTRDSGDKNCDSVSLVAPSHQKTDSEELYCQQMGVLEKRLGKLLPALPREKLSTNYVQAKLEESMQKPYGRFDQFKLQIGRVWRTFLESTDSSYEVPDVD